MVGISFSTIGLSAFWLRCCNIKYLTVKKKICGYQNFSMIRVICIWLHYCNIKHLIVEKYILWVSIFTNYSMTGIFAFTIQSPIDYKVNDKILLENLSGLNYLTATGLVA